ncbi:MAG: hypothetical protein IPJ20_13085 [Flammeovirgaceae bacterium]|nr:hypothetical protein [Flammeovirgaceae bacterium]
MINKKYIQEKIWPVLVSLGGAVVMLLAFLIPSVQDQWDRFQSRKVIEQYVAIGDNLFDENHFTMAETAYQKAFDLSAEQRLDIDVKRLNARVNRILENETWGSKPPDDLEEIDFQFLLHIQKGQKEVADRVATLNSYGIFLAAGKEEQKPSNNLMKQLESIQKMFSHTLIREIFWMNMVKKNWLKSFIGRH